MGMMGGIHGIGHEMIQNVDTNDDGSLSQDEINAAIDARFTKYDADKNGSISLQEFESLVRERRSLIKGVEKLFSSHICTARLLLAGPTLTCTRFARRHFLAVEDAAAAVLRAARAPDVPVLVAVVDHRLTLEAARPRGEAGPHPRGIPSSPAGD